MPKVYSLMEILCLVLSVTILVPEGWSLHRQVYSISFCSLFLVYQTIFKSIFPCCQSIQDYTLLALCRFLIAKYLQNSIYNFAFIYLQNFIIQNSIYFFIYLHNSMNN